MSLITEAYAQNPFAAVCGALEPSGSGSSHWRWLWLVGSMLILIVSASATWRPGRSR